MLPESYNELNGGQLMRVADALAQGWDGETAKFYVLKALLKVGDYEFGMIPLDAKVRMYEHIGWVFEKNTLTEQLIPRYMLEKKLPWFYGPKKEFENLTLSEFHFAERFYRNIVKHNDEEALNLLICVLYRPMKAEYDFAKDSDGDGRVKFNNNELPFYVKMIEDWPVGVKQAVVMWYDGNRQHLLELYDEVFNGDDGKDNDEGMFGIIRGLSGPVYGTIERVEVLNIHTALTEISKQIEEAADITTPTTT